MTDVAKIKTRLEEELRKLTARVEEIDDDLRQTGDDDWAEQAKESEDDEVLEEVGEVTLDEIREIKLALSRIDAGKYGLCTKCGGPIVKDRLKALPYATKCVNCA